MRDVDRDDLMAIINTGGMGDSNIIRRNGLLFKLNGIISKVLINIPK